MINLTLQLTNPWIKHKFSNLLSKTKILSENKALEFEILYSSESVFEFQIIATHKADHAGVLMNIFLLGLGISIHFYDVRHWDNLINDWVVYDED